MAKTGNETFVRSHKEGPNLTVRDTVEPGDECASPGSSLPYNSRSGVPSQKGGSLLHLTHKKRLQRASNGAGEPSGSIKPHSEVRNPRRDWNNELSNKVKSASEHCSPKARKKINKRTDAFLKCGNHVKANRCECCNAPIPNSGIITTTNYDGTAKPCHHPMCDICNRTRSIKRARALLHALLKLPLHKGYTFKHVTLTWKYDPSNPDHVSIEGLRKRAIAAKKSIKEAWSYVMGPKNARGWVLSNIEIAGEGNVHAHLLAYCPYVNKEGLEAALKKVSADLPDGIESGHCWIECLGDKPANELVRSKVWEVTKYNAKGPSALNEESYDHGVMRMDPELAAKWCLATMDGMHSRICLSQVYGDLRGKMTAEQEIDSIDEIEENQRDCGLNDVEKCPHCSSTEFREVIEYADSFVRECHRRGYGALRNSRWKPRDK